MTKQPNYKAKFWLPLTASLLLAGCGGGDDGANGEPGKPGEILPPTTRTAERLNIEVTQVNEQDGTLTVHFKASDQHGTALVGINDVRTTVAKLSADNASGGHNWVSYLRKSTKVDHERFPDVDDVSHASSDKGGELIDNGDGSYQYQLKSNLQKAKDPITKAPIEWQQQLTHRIGVEVRSSDDYPVANVAYDWVPDGGDVTETRKIVSSDACRVCHTELDFHGGSRIETDNCVTCHNADNVDPISGESLDLKVMAHKLHHGLDLPSLKQEGTKYSIFTSGGADERIYGENDGIWVLSNKGTIDGVNYPMDIRNCTSCHADEADHQANPDLITPITADAGNWKTVPSIAACGSCHDNIAFTQQMLDANHNLERHVSFPIEDGTCLSCHGEGNTFSVAAVHTKAAMDKKEAGKEYGYQFEVTHLEPVSGVDTAYDAHVLVTKDGQGVTLGDEYLQFKNSVRLFLNWDNGLGFETHVGKKTPNSFELDKSSDCRDGGETGQIICRWDTANDPYINGGQPLTSGHILTSFISSGVCVDSRNQLVNCEDNNALEKISSPSTVVNRFFEVSSLTEDEHFELKLGASFDRCGSCHEQVIQHDSRRSDDPSQCKACHNANRFTRSPADSPRDGGSSDLKFEVHKIHSNYRFAYADNSFDMVGRLEYYPAPIADCSQCHEPDQIDLPLAQNPRPSIARAPATSLDDGTTLGRDGAVYTSPIATVCSSCHLSVGPGLIGADGNIVTDALGNTLLTRDLSSNGIGYDNGEFPQVPVTLTADEKSLLNHMIQMGGAVFGASSEAEAAGTESCSVCHAIGSTTGVDKVHGQLN
ncbi:OmcA/MtrC family decaheme c-type cytochrome [Ferrimonas aestuarii]|uniref:OmcA/MtrC family decaheme c-type cytochrome n=1 Tax=Ferrimonas aestuarii TaxID=2569539 RepID=A0A4U1BR70_9GAMM|nr:OmcA/MtrC family decaheme c-type cytochrome [Ferrimonas aestuarii]TKB56675.1 OmcA/MtrC family decaheme c-type cytochrome [Ferrimonas aestuarii]